MTETAPNLRELCTLLDVSVSRAKAAQERARRLMKRAGVEALGVANPPAWICLVAYTRGPLNIGGNEHAEVTTRAIKEWTEAKEVHQALFTSYRLGGRDAVNALVHDMGKIPREERRMRAKIKSAREARSALASTKKYLAKETKRLEAQIAHLTKTVKYYEKEGIYAEIERRARLADGAHEVR